MQVGYARVFTDASGETHFDDIPVDVEAKDFAPPADPLLLSLPFETTRSVFLVGKAGWVGKWHPAPARQFMVTLDGQFDVEVSDGEKRSFTSESVLMLADTTGKGHFTQVPGGQDALLFVTQLTDSD